MSISVIIRSIRQVHLNLPHQEMKWQLILKNIEISLISCHVISVSETKLNIMADPVVTEINLQCIQQIKV